LGGKGVQRNSTGPVQQRKMQKNFVISGRKKMQMRGKTRKEGTLLIGEKAIVKRASHVFPGKKDLQRTN